MKLHPHDLTLQELLETLGSKEKEFFQHILFCPSCLERTRNLLGTLPTTAGVKVIPLDRWSAAARAAASRESSSEKLESLQSSFQREREAAAGLVAELLSVAVERQRLLVLNQKRYQTWAVCEQLLNQSQEANFSDGAYGEHLAAISVEIADRLDVSTYGSERVEDLKARAWAYLGNSRRIRSDLEGAEVAFEHAMAHLKAGTGEPMERAVLLDLRASLLRAQRRLDEAQRTLRRAIGIFREIGETHRAGRSLIGMTSILEARGEQDKAIPLLYEALELIDPEREPRLVVAVWHNLITLLATSGRFMEAQKISIQARPVFQRFPEPWVQNRRRWTEAKIAYGLGQREQAEALFLAARTGFLEEGGPYEVALVALDLAGLYLDQGRIDEVRQVTEEAFAVFSSRQVHREALGAFLHWREAVAAGRAKLEIATTVSAFLNRSRNDQTLRFQPPEAPASAGD